MAGKKLGPRVTVFFGTRKVKYKGKATDKKLYIYPLKSIADYYGIKAETSPYLTTKRKGSNGAVQVRVRGATDAAVKIPKGTPAAGKAQNWASIPVPGPADAKMIESFLKTKITQNKPTKYISRNGMTLFLS
ncbi:hypothetical protein [Floridanema aerugineum]|uniref:Uncharacterized protein n=1 Tax=Floridaenema aerugineum BLCC-F46 TaxID=3153654 RepID=A0ABV4XA26_9CYAN